MASKSKIEIILNAKDTGLTAAMTKAKAQVSAFSASISSASAPFRSLISSALSLKTTLAGLVAGAHLEVAQALGTEARPLMLGDLGEVVADDDAIDVDGEERDAEVLTLEQPDGAA